jgi:hypothetical protein
MGWEMWLFWFCEVSACVLGQKQMCQMCVDNRISKFLCGGGKIKTRSVGQSGGEKVWSLVSN